MHNQVKQGQKALEITMRDVLDGLEDAASYINYQSVPDTIEILSIEPPGRLNQQNSQVIKLEVTRSQNIVDYLLQRELKKSA